RGKLLLWHSGGIDGMKAMVVLVPEEHLGVIILANRGGTQLTEAMGYRLVDTWMGPPVRDWSKEMLADHIKHLEEAARAEKKVEEARVPGTHPTLGLDKYAAVYASDLYGDQRITLENGRLVWHGHSLFNGPLEHWHYDTFRTTGPQQGFVTFGLGADTSV